MENGMVQIVISSATVIGAIGYLLHTLWTGYGKFRDYVYAALKAKLETTQCSEYRRLEEEVVARIERDVDRLKGGGGRS